ncbi:MAG: hypothetical protein GY820_10445 [Gammaproteobacteria bacterium]|nr:hypothetical protein [Gammaproteobacteria bacterium]
MTELSLEVVESQLPTQQRLLVNENTIKEINKLAQDPDYGEEFLTSYLDHLQILSDNPKNNHRQYLVAIKFYSLVEAGNSLTDAYIKVFPERYEARRKNHDEPDKTIMRGEASRFNASKLVNEIRDVAAMPVKLIHRHLLHEAILENAVIMRTAKSEMVRQKAADTLIRELKPTEDATIKVDVQDNTTSIIDELRKATQELASEQHKSVMAGVPLKKIAAARIFDKDEDIIDVET